MNKRTIVLLMVVVVVGAIISFLALKYITPAQFTFEVIRRPRTPPGNLIAIAGQKCVFLVFVEDEEGLMQGYAGQGEIVDVSASGPGRIASVTVYPQSITPGQVAEVTVIPSITSINETFTVTITGERYGLVQTEIVTIEVIPGQDDLIYHAVEMRDLFISWLAGNHPEFGIKNETEWTGTIVNPRILVVMHYIFYSDDWEMYLTWHVTIPPYDWTRIYLRRRFIESQTSYAFEISSVEGQETPHLIEVPDWV